jgi:hypothetical protein
MIHRSMSINEFYSHCCSLLSYFNTILALYEAINLKYYLQTHQNHTRDKLKIPGNIPLPPLLTPEEENLLLSLMVSTNYGSFVPSELPWGRISEQMDRRTPASGIRRRYYNADGLRRTEITT